VPTKPAPTLANIDGKPESWYYLETQTEGGAANPVKRYLQARNVGLCMCHSRIMGFHVVCSTRPTLFLWPEFVVEEKNRIERLPEHVASAPGYPDRKYYLNQVGVWQKSCGNFVPRAWKRRLIKKFTVELAAGLAWPAWARLGQPGEAGWARPGHPSWRGWLRARAALAGPARPGWRQAALPAGLGWPGWEAGCARPAASGQARPGQASWASQGPAG